MSGTPLTATRRFDQVSMAVTAAHDSAGTLISNSTDSYEVVVINTGNEAIEYKVDSGPWFKLDVRASSSPLAISLATSAIRLRLAGVGPTSSAQLDITSLTGAYSAGDDVLDLGSDAPGGGATTFAALTDAASVDLPTINAPLAAALAGVSSTVGAVIHYPNAAAFRAAVAAEQANVLASHPVWADGQAMSVAGEPPDLIRVWNVSLNNANTVLVGTTTYVLAADTNVVWVVTTGNQTPPDNSIGVDGDLAVDGFGQTYGRFIYLNTAGSWGNLGETVKLTDLYGGTDPGSYESATVYVDTYGRVTSVSAGAPAADTQLVAPLASGIISVDCSLGSFFTVSQDQDVTSFAFTNIPAAGVVYYFVLEIIGGGSAIAWTFTGGTVQWADGVVGVPQQGQKNLYVFYTYDAGTTWLGTIIGENYVAG